MPIVNLIPMLDVLMTVLTFFIVVSMVLTNPRAVEVELPSSDTDPAQQQQPKLPDPLVVELTPQGQIVLSNQSLNKEQLTQQMQTYLAQNPKGAVLLNADPKLNYEQVVQLLSDMRDVGGNRVSLAVSSE